MAHEDLIGTEFTGPHGYRWKVTAIHGQYAWTETTDRPKVLKSCINIGLLRQKLAQA